MSALGFAVGFATLFGLRVAVGIGQSALFPLLPAPSPTGFKSTSAAS